MGAGAFPALGPDASPFSGAGGKEPSACSGFASRWAGCFPSFKRRRPAGRGGSFPALGPDASPFSGPGTKEPNARTRFASRRARGVLSRRPAPTPRPFSGPEKRGGRTPARALPPDGRARGFPSFKRRRPAGCGGSFPPPCPNAPPFSGAGGKEPSACSGFASRWAGESFPPFKRRRPAGRGGAFPALGPNAPPFSGSRGEGAKRLHGLCLPMGGREAFRLSKGVAPPGAEVLSRRPAPTPRPFRGAGGKKPSACSGFASRGAGETLSVFQKASPRWAWGVPFPPRPDASPFSGPGTKGPRTCPGFASRGAGERLSIFQKASPRQVWGAFPILGPDALPFSWLGNEGAERLHGLCLPMGGREAFRLSKGVAPLGAEVLSRRPAPTPRPFSGPEKRRDRTPARVLLPAGRGAFRLSKGVAPLDAGGPFPPGPDALPFSGPGTKGPRARTSFASRRARGVLSLPGPTALPFFWLGNEGAERLPWLCLPMGGQEAFHLSKGVASSGMGAFPALGPDASPFSGAGGKEPSACTGFASRWAGERLSTFQKASPRWARRSFPARPRRLALFGGRERRNRTPARDFPARPRRPALYGSRGKKEPNVCPGRASSAGNGASRWAGRVHSTFQAVSSRRAQRMNFR